MDPITTSHYIEFLSHQLQVHSKQTLLKGAKLTKLLPGKAQNRGTIARRDKSYVYAIADLKSLFIAKESL